MHVDLAQTGNRTRFTRLLGERATLRATPTAWCGSLGKTGWLVFDRCLEHASSAMAASGYTLHATQRLIFRQEATLVLTWVRQCP